jgi:hypothetical protein
VGGADAASGAGVDAADADSGAGVDADAGVCAGAPAQATKRIAIGPARERMAEMMAESRQFATYPTGLSRAIRIL